MLVGTQERSARYWGELSPLCLPGIEPQLHCWRTRSLYTVPTTITRLPNKYKPPKTDLTHFIPVHTFRANLFKIHLNIMFIFLCTPMSPQEISPSQVFLPICMQFSYLIHDPHHARFILLDIIIPKNSLIVFPPKILKYACDYNYNIHQHQVSLRIFCCLWIILVRRETLDRRTVNTLRNIERAKRLWRVPSITSSRC